MRLGKALALLLMGVLLFSGFALFLGGSGPLTDDTANNPIFYSGTWSSTTTYTTTLTSSQNHEAVLDENGDLNMVWVDRLDGFSEIYYQRMTPEGQTKVAPIKVSKGVLTSAHPSLALDMDGNVHVAWMDNRDGNWEFYYKELNPLGGTNHEEIRLTYTPFYGARVYNSILSQGLIGVFRNPSAVTNLKDGSLFNPRLAVDSMDNVHLVWSDHRGERFQVRYSVVAPDGTLLIDDLQISSTSSESLNPEILIDSIDRVHVLWNEQSTNNKLVYVRLNDTGAYTVRPTTLTWTQADYAVDFSAAIGSSGEIHVAWEDQARNDGGVMYSQVYYMAVNDTGMRVATPRPVSSESYQASSPTVAVGEDGITHLAWSAQAPQLPGVSQIRYSKLDTGVENFYPAFDLTNTFSDSAQACMLMMPEGQPMVVWSDNQDGSRNVYGARELVSTSAEPSELIYQTPIGDYSTLFMMAGLMSIGGFLAFLEAGRRGLTAVPFAIPLYSRIRRSDILENEVRGKIFELIKADPGINFKAIMVELDLKNGVLAYHLQRLEAEDFIKSRKDRQYRRYYSAESNGLPEELPNQILRFLLNNPGISQSDLAKMLGISRQVVNYHIHKLIGQRKVIRKKRGRVNECYIHPNANVYWAT